MAYLNTAYDRFQEPREPVNHGPEEFDYDTDELFLTPDVIVFNVKFGVVLEDDGFRIWRITVGGEALDPEDKVHHGISDAIEAYFNTPYGQELLYDRQQELVD